MELSHPGLSRFSVLDCQPTVFSFAPSLSRFFWYSNTITTPKKAHHTLLSILFTNLFPLPIKSPLSVSFLSLLCHSTLSLYLGTLPCHDHTPSLPRHCRHPRSSHVPRPSTTQSKTKRATLQPTTRAKPEVDPQGDTPAGICRVETKVEGEGYRFRSPPRQLRRSPAGPHFAQSQTPSRTQQAPLSS